MLLNAAVRHIERYLERPFVDGYRSEVLPQLPYWVQAVVGGLRRGAMVFVDYGYARDEFYQDERSDGTVRAFYRHRVHNDVYRWPGLQDITASVDFTALAEAGTLQSLVGNRNNARWIVAGVERQRPLFPGSPEESMLELPPPTTGEDVLSDYRALGLTLGAHPMSLLRERMRARRLLGSRDLQDRRHGSHVHAVGLVTNRQRPAAAHGTMFVTLEDEHGMVNVVVWEHVALRRRKALLGASLLAVRGRWEQVDGVAHLIAQDMQDLSDLLGSLRTASRDFH